MPPMEDEVNRQPPSAMGKGLLNAAPEPAAEPPTDDDGPRTATPEQQEQYDTFIYQAFQLFYSSPELASQVVGMLRGGGEDGEGDPIEGLARAASTVIVRVIQSAKENGVALDNDVIWEAGGEVFLELADLSGDAGIKDFSTDEDALEGAFFRALDYIRLALQEGGDINEEEAKASFAKLEEMDASGDLSAVLMKMDEQYRTGQGGPNEEKPAADPMPDDEMPTAGEQPPPEEEGPPAGKEPPPRPRGLLNAKGGR